jgi:hypothetical protein
MTSWLKFKLGGRMRVSTAVLLVAFVALFWVNYNVEATPKPEPAAPAVVPPGFVPDPNYTWVPRTNVRRPKEPVETYTTTTTTPTTTTTSPSETTSPTSPTSTTSPTSPTSTTSPTSPVVDPDGAGPLPPITLPSVPTVPGAPPATTSPAN